jgi:hypothetical protein
MSEPKTHFIRHHHMYLPESPDFATYAMVEYYYYSDAIEENARLKAEVERLDTLCKQVMAQHSDISCENIMLRKAGDAMADRLMYQGYPKTVPAWNAAKEGKGQS